VSIQGVGPHSLAVLLVQQVGGHVNHYDKKSGECACTAYTSFDERVVGKVKRGDEQAPVARDIDGCTATKKLRGQKGQVDGEQVRRSKAKSGNRSEERRSKAQHDKGSEQDRPDAHNVDKLVDHVVVIGSIENEAVVKPAAALLRCCCLS